MPTMQVDPRITVERPGEERLAALKVKSWPMWTKEPSSFEWHYDERETCYFLQGFPIWTTMCYTIYVISAL